MRYTVVWKRVALNRLAELWAQAVDRDAITKASNALDRALASDPYADSESRSGTDRIRFHGPLGIAYRVSDEDRLVTVGMVWHVKRRGDAGP